MVSAAKRVRGKSRSDEEAVAVHATPMPSRAATAGTKPST